MTVNNDFEVYQTVFYDSYGTPVLLKNRENEPQLDFDKSGNKVVIADYLHNPKVIMDNQGILHVIQSTRVAPVPMSNSSQSTPTSNFTKQVSEAPTERVKHSNDLSQSTPAVKRNDIYRRVKKLGVDSAKQLLFYESILINNSRFFINFDEEDTYHFLTDQIMLQPDPISRLDYLVSTKTYGSIPDSFLNWFSNDLRAGIYFSSFVSFDWFDGSLYGEAEFLYWIKSIIKVSKLTVENNINIDINISNNQYLRENNIKNLVLMKKNYLNTRTKIKKIKWLDEADAEQIDWAYEYLIDNGIVIFNGNFFPETVKDKYNVVLAKIDLANDEKIEYSVSNGKNTLTFTQRGFCIYKMRKAWNSILGTRKKAEQKDKRSITVNQSNYDKLLKLGAHYDLTTSNKVINKLITDEYDRITGKDNKELIDIRLTNIGHSKYKH